MTEIGATTPPDSGLSDALDRALAGMSRVPGSAVMSSEIAALVGIAGRLQLSATNVRPTATYRATTRERLMARIAPVAAMPPQEHGTASSWRQRAAIWAVRLSAAFGALSLAGAATASASASALPGDPLYVVKQVQENAVLQAAPSDSARQTVLLQQAGTRLDETGRLLDQGRQADADANLARYDQVLAAASQPETAPTEVAQTQLERNQTRLNELLNTAPAPARGGLEHALQATQRRLANSSRIAPTDDEARAALQASIATDSAPAAVTHEQVATPGAISTAMVTPESPGAHAEAPDRVTDRSESALDGEVAPAEDAKRNGPGRGRAISDPGNQAAPPPNVAATAPKPAPGRPAPAPQPPGRSRH